MQEVLTASAFSVLFVLGAYLDTLCRGSPEPLSYSRMLCQSLSVFAVSGLSYVSLFCLSPPLPLTLFLENAFDLTAIAKVLLINSCLFLGPIVINWYSSEESDSMLSKVSEPSPYNVKAFLVAPLIEELHFRLLLLLVLDPTQEHPQFYLWTSSLLFSLAHSHRVFTVKIDRTVLL